MRTTSLRLNARTRWIFISGHARSPCTQHLANLLKLNKGFDELQQYDNVDTNFSYRSSSSMNSTPMYRQLITKRLVQLIIFLHVSQDFIRPAILLRILTLAHPNLPFCIAISNIVLEQMQESTNRTTNVFTTTTVTVHTHTSVRKTVGFIGCLCKRLTSVVHLLHNCQKSKTKLPKAVAVPLHRRQLLSKPTFYLCERPWVHLARLPRRQRRENSRLHRLGRDGTSTGGTVFRFRPRQLSLARLRRACTLGEKTRDGP